MRRQEQTSDCWMGRRLSRKSSFQQVSSRAIARNAHGLRRKFTDQFEANPIQMLPGGHTVTSLVYRLIAWKRLSEELVFGNLKNAIKRLQPRPGLLR